MAVRREQVVLDLTDNLTPGLARAAVAAKVLDRELKSMGRTSVGAGRDLDRSATSVRSLGDNTGRAGPQIDRFSGRLKLMADAALILGPAVGALGAAAVGGVVALSAQMGALAGGLGVTVLAVKGLGDGLKALDTYQLEPTAENLAKLNLEMEKLGPAGEHFARFLDGLEPELKSLQTAARDGLFPGVEEGITSLLDRLPELRSLVSDMASTMGDLSADAGKALGGKRFDAFFEYLRTDGIKILDDTSRTLGNLAEAAANTFAAFGGVSTDFSGGLLKFSEGLAKASANLESSAGFQEFIAYISTEGPHALETLGSLANAFLQIVEATAPLGGPVLTIVGQFADVIAKIADSDIGTPLFAAAAALALVNRSMAVTASLTAATFGGPAVASMRAYVTGLGTVVSAQERAQMSAAELDAANAKASGSFGKFALPAAGLALTMSGVADDIGLSNTAMLSMAGPWGVAAGVVLDLKSAYDGLNDSIDSINAAAASGDLDLLTAKITETKAKLADLQDTSGTEAVTKGFLQAIGLSALANPQEDIGRLTGKTGELEDALSNAEKSARALSEAEGDVAESGHAAVGPLRFLRIANEQNAEAATEHAAAINDAVEAMRSMREEALRARNAELDYQASIDDANKALKENGRTVDKTTDKGRDNLRALYNLAGAWNGQSDVIKSNSGRLREARQNFIDTATAMGMAKGEARKLSRELFEIPTKRQIDITVDANKADATLRALKARMDAIQSKTVTVNVRQMGGQAAAPAADGGTVPKSGRPYADRYHYVLADGEEVISNRRGQADRHRGLLKAINAGRLAEGGTAGGSTGGGGVNGYTPFLAINELGNAAHHASTALKRLEKQLAAQQKAYDKAKSARDEAISRRDAISGSIQQGLMGDSIWAGTAASGGVWGAGSTPGGAATPASAMAALQARKARAERLVAAINALKAKGVTGAALLEIIGDGDVERAEAMAALDVGSLTGFSTTLNQTNQALAAAGLAGGNAIEGDNIRSTQRKLDRQIDELREIKHAIHQANADNKKAQDKNAKDVGDNINGAGHRGHRRGK